jgi:site-specific recombinase XerD
MTVREARDYWLLDLEARGAARDTTRTYREHSDYLLRFVGDGDLSPFTIRAFLADYRAGHANASLRTVFTSLRAFLRFAVREGMLDGSLLAGLRPPKRIETEKAIYSQGQLRALFGALSADTTPLGLRDNALCAILLDCGLRASEACALRLDSMRDGALIVGPSKSGRMRTAPLGEKSQRAVYRWLAAGRPRLGPKCDALLTTDDGKPTTRNTVRLALKRLSERVGFAVSAHRFRHTFATTMLRKGCDLETLRRLGGWADYSMLRTYVHLADADLRASQRRFSALDGL